MDLQKVTLAAKRLTDGQTWLLEQVASKGTFRLSQEVVDGRIVEQSDMAEDADALIDEGFAEVESGGACRTLRPTEEGRSAHLALQF